MAIPLRRDSHRTTSPEAVTSTLAPTPQPVYQTRLGEIALTGLRVIAGLMFMQHGFQKLFGFFVDPSRPMPSATMFSQFWFAGVLEVFGGALIVLGLFTRPVAFILAGEMAVAYFQVHFPRSFWPILNQGESSVLFCWVFLAFAAIGGGRYSVDGLRHRSRHSTTNSVLPSV